MLKNQTAKLFLFGVLTVVITMGMIVLLDKLATYNECDQKQCDEVKCETIQCDSTHCDTTKCDKQ
jgi:hypothetical protein